VSSFKVVIVVIVVVFTFLHRSVLVPMYFWAFYFLSSLELRVQQTVVLYPSTMQINKEIKIVASLYRNKFPLIDTDNFLFTWMLIKFH
jgi:hypothetical protein